jgi:hypothetical protein
LLEEVDALNRITLACHGVKHSKLPKPLVVPRPGEKEREQARRKANPKAWVHALMGAKADNVTVVG